MEFVDWLAAAIGGLFVVFGGVAAWLNARGEQGRQNLGKRIGGVDDKVGEVEKETAVLKADRDRINARLELLEKGAEKWACKQDLRDMEERINTRIDELKSLIQARK